MNAKIGQQIYTRERRGLFRASEGYDSVAKSANLSDAFVKENLHPYCVYNPSRKLQAANAPPEDYPPAFTVARYPDGRTLVGRAVYLAADFTGQRSTFFAHNYVLPPLHIFTPKMLNSIEFMSGYDITAGNELPEIDELPVTGERAGGGAPECDELAVGDGPVLNGPRDKSFAALGVTKPQFIKLLSFIFQSAAGTKKVFIQAPVEPRLTSGYAIDLLTALWNCLPPFIKNSLGFLTYAREPENKKGLHIVFLEAGSIRRGDPRISRDFFIDMTRDTGPEDATQHTPPYASFLWDNADNAGEIAAFYNFASAFKEEPTLSRWDDLTLIYSVAHENPEIFREVTPALARKARAEQNFRKPLAALTRRLETALFSAYINLLIHEKTPEVFLGYAEECAQSAQSPAALFTELRFWLANVPAVFGFPAFIRIIRFKTGEFIDKAAEPINMAKILYGNVEALFEGKEENAGRLSKNGKKLTALLSGVIGERLTPRLDFKNLTRSQLAALPQAYINRGKTGSSPAPFLTLEILKTVSHSLDAGVKINLRCLTGSYKLPKDAREFIAVKLKEFYAGYAREPHFETLAELMEGAELLEFVNAKCHDAVTRAAFLVWALEAGEIKLHDPAHLEAAKAFIKLNIKDGAFKERIYSNPALKDLARSVRFGKLAGILNELT